jgi:anhydro-N-acetylmuramic acid kinase
MRAVNEAPFYIGLISGTSRDGVDAALVRFEQSRPLLQASLCLPYPDQLARQLSDLLSCGRRPSDSALAKLDATVSRHFADTADQLLAGSAVTAASVRAIGSHGQTVWHEPQGPRPESIQLGDPAVIAERTGITTVGDFRRADIEMGGQGAPLAPLLHAALFRPATGCRVVLNLGGIANISVIDADGSVRGFDTGPANCLLDAWVQTQQGRPFDRAGAWAASGQSDPGLLRDLLQDPWFARAAPKSTGIEYFNLGWLRKALNDRQLTDCDVQATLAELTAASVAAAVEPAGAEEVLICGGGVHNPDLISRLQRRLPGLSIRSTSRLGLNPDWVEAVLFAWLARERLAGRPQDTRSITGAHAPVLLGTIANPPALE